jgi:hypothetical protein
MTGSRVRFVACSVSCGGDDGTHRGAVVCESLDCPVLFERRKRVHELGICTELLQQAIDW